MITEEDEGCFVLDANEVPISRPEYAFETDPPHMVDEYNGLLAVGGYFNTLWLQTAYYNACFPWFIAKGKPHWYCPPVRGVLFPDQIRINRSLRKFLRKQDYRIWVNRDKTATVRNCATIRHDGDDTWISEEYIKLYPVQPNFVSIEIYSRDDRMVGGLYGLLVGGVFCGESQFSIESNTSKLATVALCRWCLENDITVIDCQLPNEYLESLGEISIPREEYLFKYFYPNIEKTHDFSIFEKRQLDLTFF